MCAAQLRIFSPWAQSTRLCRPASVPCPTLELFVVSITTRLIKRTLFLSRVAPGHTVGLESLIVSKPPLRYVRRRGQLRLAQIELRPATPRHGTFACCPTIHAIAFPGRENLPVWQRQFLVRNRCAKNWISCVMKSNVENLNPSLRDDCVM